MIIEIAKKVQNNYKKYVQELNKIIYLTYNNNQYLTKENKMKNLTITNQYNDNMIPCIIFDEFEPVFIFVDTKNNVCCKNNYATIELLVF